MMVVLDDDLGCERSAAPSVNEKHHANTLAANSMDLRQELHRTLKELAFSLGEAAIRSDQLSGVLSELLQLEEEIQSLTGQIRLLEQNFERIRFEAGEQETMLRYATLDLKLMRSKKLERLQESPGPEIEAEVKDLTFQIETLDARLFEIVEDKRTRTQKLNEEVQRYKQACSQREEDVARLYTELHMLVEGVRKQARADSLLRLYEKLDTLSGKLQLARDSVRFMQR